MQVYEHSPPTLPLRRHCVLRYKIDFYLYNSIKICIKLPKLCMILLIRGLEEDSLARMVWVEHRMISLPGLVRRILAQSWRNKKQQQCPPT